MKRLYKHHIVPKHAGGSDDPSNIKLVTLEQHAEEHRLLWEKHNRKQDYFAWKMLAGEISKEEAIIEMCRENGRRQGKKNAESGFMKEIQKMYDHVKSGKAGAKVSEERKTNSFYNEELRKMVTVKGGQVQGRINAENGHLKRIALLPRKYMPKKWYNNGEESILVKEGQQPPKGYKKGRICPRKKN